MDLCRNVRLTSCLNKNHYSSKSTRGMNTSGLLWTGLHGAKIRWRFFIIAAAVRRLRWWRPEDKLLPVFKLLWIATRTSETRAGFWDRWPGSEISLLFLLPSCVTRAAGRGGGRGGCLTFPPVCICSQLIRWVRSCWWDNGGRRWSDWSAVEVDAGRWTEPLSGRRLSERQAEEQIRSVLYASLVPVQIFSESKLFHSKAGRKEDESHFCSWRPRPPSHLQQN